MRLEGIYTQQVLPFGWDGNGQGVGVRVIGAPAVTLQNPRLKFTPDLPITVKLYLSTNFGKLDFNFLVI